MSKKTTKDFNFGELPTVADNGKVEIKEKAIEKEVSTTSKLVKLSAEVEEDLREKVNDYAYQTGLTQTEIVVQALELYFSDKKVTARPQRIKERKVGRKPKVLQTI